MMNKLTGLLLFLMTLSVGLTTFTVSDVYAGSCSASYSISPPSPPPNTLVNVTFSANTSNNLCIIMYRDGSALEDIDYAGEGSSDGGFNWSVYSGAPGQHTLQAKYGQQSYYPSVPNCQEAITCNSFSFTTASLPTTPTPTPTPARQALCSSLDVSPDPDPPDIALAPWQPFDITSTAVPSAQVKKFQFAFFNNDTATNKLIRFDSSSNPNKDFYVNIDPRNPGDTSLKQTFYFTDFNKVDLNTGQKPTKITVNGYFIDQNGQPSIASPACSRNFKVTSSPTSPTCTITGLPSTIDRNHGGTYSLTASTSDAHVKRLQLWYSFKDSPGPSDWRNIGGTDNQACSTSSGTPCTKTLTLAPSDIPADASKLTAVCNAYYKDENNPLAAAPVGADIMCGGSPVMVGATLDNPYRSPTSGTTWSYCGAGSFLQASLTQSCLDTGDFNGQGPHDPGNFDVWKDAFTKGLRGLPASISNCSGMTVDLKAFNAWRRKDLGL